MTSETPQAAWFWLVDLPDYARCVVVGGNARLMEELYGHFDEVTACQAGRLNEIPPATISCVVISEPPERLRDCARDSSVADACYRALRPRGGVIVVEPNAPWYTRWHGISFSRSMASRLRKAGFTMSRLYAEPSAQRPTFIIPDSGAAMRAYERESGYLRRFIAWAGAASALYPGVIHVGSK
jgi:hypothetical protein